MAVTTRPFEASPPGAVLRRFDRAERVAHWATAALFLMLIASGATLYLDVLGRLVGRRALVEDVHLYCGLALPVPLVVGLIGPWGRGLRADLRRLNRWRPDDRAWLGAVLRRSGRGGLQVGKFNAGQKLNGAFITGAGLVMLGTGVIMRWYHPWPLDWRTGATFVHDYLALAAGLVVAGHIWMGVRHPEALGSMVHGRVSRRWAEREAPAWVEGADGPPPTPDPPPPRPAHR